MKITVEVAYGGNNDLPSVELWLDDEQFGDLIIENETVKVLLYNRTLEFRPSSPREVWPLPYDELIAALEAANETILGMKAVSGQGKQGNDEPPTSGDHLTGKGISESC